MVFILYLLPKLSPKPAPSSCSASSGLPRNPWITSGTLSGSSLRSASSRCQARTQCIISGFWYWPAILACRRKTDSCTGIGPPLSVSRPHSPMAATRLSAATVWSQLHMSSLIGAHVSQGCIPALYHAWPGVVSGMPSSGRLVITSGPRCECECMSLKSPRLFMAQGHSRNRPTDGSGKCVSLPATTLVSGRVFAMPQWHIGCMWACSGMPEVA